MKTLLLTMMLAIGYIASSQNTIQSTHSQIGMRFNKSKDWKWKNIKPCTIKFTLNNDRVIANDKAKSIYVIYETIEVSSTVIMWNVIDEKNKLCTVLIEHNYPNSKIEIEYINICYRYFF